MGEFFNIENIITGSDISSEMLFEDTDTNVEDNDKTQETPPAQQEENNNDNKTTEVVDSLDLFEDTPEGVSSDEDTKGKEDTTSDEDDDTPEKPNFYSSITDALVDDGVFPDLTPEQIKNIQSPEDFRQLIEDQIKAQFDEKTKRINDALNVGIAPDEVKEFETTISYLDNISPELISEESSRGEDIRRRLIMQSFLNKGFTQEKANKLAQKSFNGGEDIEDAKEALEENKKYFSQKYDDAIRQAREEAEEEKKQRQKQADKLKSDILNNAKYFDDIELDKSTRQKVVDNIMKPTYKDPETGDYLTPIQKYELEHKDEFIKNVGYIFTLTDGFKDLNRLIRPSAKKEVKQKLKELETTLNNTVKDKGSIKLVSSHDSDSSKSIFDRGFTLDL